MTLQARSSFEETDKRFMDSLRVRYEDRGFTFTADPDIAQLPAFLGSYRPHAIASKGGDTIAIEVKRRPGPSAERGLRDIKDLFAGQADWQFHVVFMGEDPLQPATVPAARPGEIRDRFGEIHALLADGQRRAAFVMTWSLLEAAFRMGNKAARGPQTPGTVLQELAMRGLIEPEMEQDLLGLVQLRNRIVHGDLHADPTGSEVALVLSAVEATLKSEIPKSAQSAADEAQEGDYRHS